MNETIQITTVQETCIVCGIYYWVTSEFYSSIRRNKSEFFCPNGHGQAYLKSEADKLRELLNEERRKASQIQFELITTERKVKRLEKRAKNGICPCCHRQFVQMTRHMKTQHPEFAMENTNAVK
jgi:hypothetical protein